MLKEFFSIPIYPDNEKYRHELFRDTKITERSYLLDSHFCKYPVIFLSLKGFDGCNTWSKMEALLCHELASLYNKHDYINDILNDYEKLKFNKIRSGELEYADKVKSLENLSKYLKIYHRRRCIVLIDEYDHPLEIAYRYQYYEEACGFFSSLFGALLKDNDDNLEKALLVGVSRITKSGYLSGLNNLSVFPMYVDKFATQFGFTEDEISILLQHYDKMERLNEVKEWYDGYRAGNGIYLYNPWSINQFIDTNTLKAHWVDTGGTKAIKDLLWNSTEVFKKNTTMLLKGHAIKIGIKEDIDYNVLIQKSNIDQVFWNLLYYAGYLTKDENDDLCIPNMEVSMEWQEWLTNCNSFELDSLLSLLLQGKLSEFKESFHIFIMNALSCHDVLVESNYHLFMLGMFHQAYCRGYKLMSNREAGEGRFDLKIEPTEKVNFKVGVYMEFKVLPKRGKDEKPLNERLQNSANEALEQIKNKRYFSGLPKFTKQCVICGVAFQGKNVCITGEVLNQW
ncbi:hypothetical protein RclHR1_06200018 [Rhizophagus clarus]|uniref:AAA-ATPase-like domain-containing protein n=1 Tax=Rhizophagus clarus TaxID=94130 RepID=A0A2Z6RX08_9GLOM|nr:hypothetical protein RclHR1_06200018 [Rhizophagus clarus]